MILLDELISSRINTLSLKNKLFLDRSKPLIREVFLFLDICINMHIRLFDGKQREHLLPFVYLRPVADIFMGMMTFRDRWARLMETTVDVETISYLSVPKASKADVCILASVIPSKFFLQAVRSLQPGQKLESNGTLLAYHGDAFSDDSLVRDYDVISVDEDQYIHIKHTWDIFSHNADALHHDFTLLVNDQNSNSIANSNTVLGNGSIFIADNVNMEATTLNTSKGHIYIDEGATVMEGALLRGPLYIGKNSVIKMGAKVYENCSFGPSVKVGGELNNVVFFGNSNKGHDGFLGNAVIGQWCNIGAGSDASNLKNDYNTIRAWDYPYGGFAITGLQFCGLLMGDHSQCSVQTTFNTATVVGVGCNLFGNGFPRQFIPSFSRGGSQGFVENRIDKVLETAKRMKERRGADLTPDDESRIREVFDRTTKHRKP